MRGEETPDRKAQIAFYRPLYGEVAADLIRFDRLTAIENVMKSGRTAPSLSLPEADLAYPLFGNSPLSKTFAANDRFGSDPLAEWDAITSALQKGGDEGRVILAGFAGARGGRPGKLIDWLLKNVFSEKPPAKLPPRDPKSGGDGPPPLAPPLPSLPRPRGAPKSQPWRKPALDRF